MAARDRTIVMEAGPEEPRRLLGRYRLIAPIGSGGVAQVWRGVDERLGRSVAVKVLEPAADRAFRRRFTEEGRRAATVVHPNVVTVYDAAETDGTSFIVMELVEGETVDELIRVRGALPPAEAARILSDVASALDAAHAAGVVHCDVKPSNVIVDRGGVAKLADFGIARAESQPDRELVGTPRYVAPEVVERRPAIARSDVYGLGLLAYELLAGRPAFEGDREQLLRIRLEREPPRLRALRPDLPSSLDQAVARAMSREPERRYGSAGEFALAISAAVDSGERTVPLAPIPVVPPKRLRRRLVLSAAGLGLLGAGVLTLLGAIAEATTIVLPDVRGRPFTETETLLRSKGLAVVAQSVPAKQRIGLVLDQAPAPGTRARRGDAVTVVVSAGVRVPGVLGMSGDEAIRTLNSSGFASVQAEFVIAQGVANTVVRQEPSAGAAVEPGATAKIFLVAPQPPRRRGRDD